MSRAGRWLVWWLDPWMRIGTRLSARAGRIALLSVGLTVTVLPAMMLRYGLDGWIWPLTEAVVLCAPLGVIGFDQLAELFDRRGYEPLGLVAGLADHGARRLSTSLRLAVLFVGLSFGVFVGYSLMFALPVLEARETALLAKDYRRSMTILASVALGLAIVGALLWYRTETFRLQAAADRARFGVLKQQMQPHFLFNSLNSLKELIAADPALAEQATQRIADLYRLLLEVAKHPTATLADELAIVENYLEIERLRYGDRLRVAFDVEPGLGALHVPCLMLQTLAENAVKHGICRAREGGEVRVRARRRADGWLELVVSNTGAPYAPSAEASGGATSGGSGSDGSTSTGLANTVERLGLMYGPASRFEITRDPELGTRVSFAVSGARVDA